MPLYNPAHPGKILKELVIESLELTTPDVANHLGISLKKLTYLLNEQTGITPEIALRLELVFHSPSASHWLRLQNAYDLWNIGQQQTKLRVLPYQVA